MVGSGCVDTIILGGNRRIHEMTVSVYRHRADGIGHVVRDYVLQPTIFFGQFSDFLYFAQVILHKPQAMRQANYRLITG